MNDMMLTIKERNEIANLHRTTGANQVGGSGRRNTSNTQHDDWDIEGEVINSGDTEGVAGRATVVALGRSEGRGGKELHLTKEADVGAGRGADRGLDGLAHITEDQVSRGARSGDSAGNGA